MDEADSVLLRRHETGHGDLLAGEDHGQGRHTLAVSPLIDIVPTLLEVTGIPAPVMVDGIGQKPIEGVSMAYTFDKANANAPSHHHTQYFEMLGVQGLYNDGWMLSAVPIRAPWQLATAAIIDPASAFKFELFDLSKDWTQYTDVAAANPRRCRR